MSHVYYSNFISYKQAYTHAHRTHTMHHHTQAICFCTLSIPTKSIVQLIILLYSHIGCNEQSNVT